jgi:hypothetical protein
MESSWKILQISLEEEDSLLLSLAQGAASLLIAHPTDFAVFARHELGDGLHCRIDLYFSPVAAPYAPLLAQLCGPPSPEGLRLVLGSQDAWQLLK